MLQADAPVGFRGVVDKVIVVIAEAGRRHILGELAVRQGLLAVAGIGAGLIQRHGVKAGKHPDVRQDRGIVGAAAVTAGADIDDHTDVERRPPRQHRLGIFRHLAVQQVAGVPVAVVDGIKVAVAEAASAAHTLFRVDHRFAVLAVGNRALCAGLGAGAAAHALLGVGRDLAAAVLLHFAGAAAAAHPDILDGAAKAGGFMPLKMRQADEHIGIHDRAPDFGRFDILAALHRHLRFVGPLQPIPDDDLAPGGQWGKAVFLRSFDMLQRVLAPADVQGIAVGQKGKPALLLYHIGDRLGVVGPQEAQVARFAEVQLDGDEFLFHIDGADPRRTDQALQLLGQVSAIVGAQVGKIHFGRIHGDTSYLFSDPYCNRNGTVCQRALQTPGRFGILLEKKPGRRSGGAVPLHKAERKERLPCPTLNFPRLAATGTLRAANTCWWILPATAKRRNGWSFTARCTAKAACGCGPLPCGASLSSATVKPILIDLLTWEGKTHEHP